jgi:hypothetical protein
VTDASLPQLQVAVAGSGLLYCIDYSRPIVLRCDASAVESYQDQNSKPG